MGRCKNCIWHYLCACDDCKDGIKVVCSKRNEHMDKNDGCIEHYPERKDGHE